MTAEEQIKDLQEQLAQKTLEMAAREAELNVAGKLLDLHRAEMELSNRQLAATLNLRMLRSRR